MWSLEPKRSVGPLILGSEKREFDMILGENSREFKRQIDFPNTLYEYDKGSVHVIISPSGTAKKISVFSPKSVELNGVQLLNRNVSDVLKELAIKGINPVKEGGGFWIEEAGVLLVEVDETVDGVELYGS